MTIDEGKDDSLLMAVIMLVPAIIRELLNRDGDTPSVKPQQEKRVWFAWLSPTQGPGIGHNPS